MNKGMEEFVGLMETAEKAGINSIRKLRYFLEFADSQGKSMAELAGKAKTQQYNEIQQAVIELSVGRYNALMAPNLVQLGSQKTAKPGTGRRKPIKLTAKGKRLHGKIEAYCTKRRH
jgi:hypothetical protein